MGRQGKKHCNNTFVLLAFKTFGRFYILPILYFFMDEKHT
jgi:hypothetical protein